MTKLSTLFLMLSLVSTIIVDAQQLPFYNHSIINPVVYNPAYAGESGDVNAYLTRGQRYMGHGSGAVNNALSLEGMSFIPNSGFGLFIGQQSIGVYDQLSAQLSYSYHLKLNENQKLSFGLAGGVLDNKINLGELNIMHEDDPFLVGMKRFKPTYDFNFGIAYAFDKLKLGLSIPQLIGQKVRFNRQNTRGYYSLSRQLMVTASYDVILKNIPKVKLVPYLKMQYTNGAPIQYDITAQFEYENVGWFSTTYKSDYAVQFNLGIHVKKNFHVGYSYELVVGSLRNNYAGTNHEFLLGYTFKSGVSNEKMIRAEKANIDLQKENEKLKHKIDLQEEELKSNEENYKKRLRALLSNRKDAKFEDSMAIEQEMLTSDDFKGTEDRFFIEMDGSESPAGYYVVVGVFAIQDNVEKKIKKVKPLFPDAYQVNNEKNAYSYAIIKYSTNKQEAYLNLKKYRSQTQDEVWLFSYKIEK
ncbi:type IX secretion system membrane protein PorP/SprF [Brumimicrobium glaciale]|uniref:Type IX secretion system membrane protein PorP/SprF n=1 Tax=Brumimicrobium glaciale TaxID=200475 RepID=A0A4Q4KKS7_9FLAO|nr:PorP/SprF family type IX secretion system membrane protein [Brumimicrobium glaciale]RYM32419.1 type IX secretion system membrane protein PorP/SprF [Brumimicrobium glaciale]